MEENNELGFCPSFSCYSSNTAETAARVSIQFQQEKEQEFEFSPNDVVSDHKSLVFPVFNRDLLTEKEHVVVCDHGPSIDTCNDSLQNLFITERERDREHEEYVSSSSESESEEGSGMLCVWRNYKTGAAGSSSSPSPSPSTLSKCKKSSSTGSGSKRWRIRDFLLMRSNSEGKEPPMILITDNSSNNKVDLQLKEKRNSGEVGVYSSGKTKPQSVHELFYVQQRAKRQDGKRKSYLPYRQGLIGRFF